ncbi:hypothetical protein I6A60_32915 [Frankia sp. AgB1.9]|uniref:hypothetical protein n=1 Tax=unclassified Frankia TaxID=2632575 RepID=UPI0019325920|nr:MULTISPECIES: hypothetical protein [unclassified Frankia]MBL7489772.1 hypothetical protein [Frankia sp. AgW1.1]MBL7552625.1 hypothetical protein [Frankia sp. AgB1.9]MBL7623713.1 hypothetical protein [Frankia sp. AgB1.8]
MANKQLTADGRTRLGHLGVDSFGLRPRVDRLLVGAPPDDCADDMPEFIAAATVAESVPAGRWALDLPIAVDAHRARGLPPA